MTTIVALGLALWQVGSEVVPLRKEVRKLRDKIGYLVIDPESKDRLQALGIAEDIPMTWKWKVYLPPGRKFRLKTKWNDIPQNGLPNMQVGSRGEELWVENDKRILEIRCVIRKNPNTAGWDIVTKQKHAGMSSSTRRRIPEKAEQWIGSPSIGSATGGVMLRHAYASEPNLLVLLRWRQMEKTSATGSSVPQGPVKGLMIWIEEVPPKVAAE